MNSQNAIRVTVTAGRGLRCPLVEQKLLLLGRGDQCGLQLTDPSVSRVHCRLLLSEGRITLDDVGSRWGERVNGAAAKGSIPERLQGCSTYNHKATVSHRLRPISHCDHIKSHVREWSSRMEMAQPVCHSQRAISREGSLVSEWNSWPDNKSGIPGNLSCRSEILHRF